MDTHLFHIRRMGELVSKSEGFDVIIVVTSTDEQAKFWEERLNKMKGQITGENSRIYCVTEDWEAGQLLGTINAWIEVSKKEDLDSLMEKGGKIAIYHTAGHGKRLAPLTASEGNNKAAVKLPRLLHVDGRKIPITLLEAVIYQTSIFAPSREGRICVFWTDQIFIPSGEVEYEGKYHVELFSIRENAPVTSEEWKKEWESYGLVIPGEEGAILLEKQSWENFRSFLEKEKIDPVNEKLIVGKGLGCFSISYEFFKEIVEEFRIDVENKKKLDTDPDLWMPLTAPQFVEEKKRKRVERFKRKFDFIFGDKDVGRNTYWWDFGQTRLYIFNLLKLTEDSDEGRIMREFFGIEDPVINSYVDGRIERSVIVDSRIENANLSECVVISSMIKGINGRKSLMYNCIELSELTAQADVISDIFHPSKGKIRMKAKVWVDGKKDWEERIIPNPYSYSELESLMRKVSIEDIQSEREIWEKYYSLDMGKEFDRLRNSVIKFQPNLVEKIWGGDRIEKLKGLPPSGRKIGESWECSAHPTNPSKIRIGEVEIPFIHLLNHCGDWIIGKQLMNDFRGEFPILIKFIDTSENVSVQVHPSDEDGEMLGEGDRGKTEAWYVLDAEPGAKVYIGVKKDVSDISEIREGSLNAIEVKKGDLFFIPAGTVHAIGKGILLYEIQESSDLTYRVWDWGRPRELHLERAGMVSSLSKANIEDFKKVPKGKELIDTIHFTLSFAESGKQKTRGSFHLLTCIEGETEIEIQGKKEKLNMGETALIPACVDSYEISCKGKVLMAYLRTPEHIDPVIFQTYDVRAVESMLSDRTCYYLGKGYASYLRRMKNTRSGELWICVGGGIRLSTERIRNSLIKGILSAGVNVYNVGITSTPELYFSIPFMKADGGINITASHNESEYNGLKQVIKSEDGFIASINADEMIGIKETILSSNFLYGNGRKIDLEEGLIPEYHNLLVESNCRLGREIWIYLLRNWDLRELLDTLKKIEFPEKYDEDRWREIREKLRIPENFECPWTAIREPLKGLKVVIDFGNGSTWRTRSVYENLGCEVFSLNENPDGRFPAHHPDPIKAKYRKQLEEETVKTAEKEKEKEVVGFGHDEDGDRVIYIRSDGRVVEGDRTLSIQAKEIISEYRKKNRKPKFMGEVKFSRIAEEFITGNGGVYIMTPTGFAFIKEGMNQTCRAVRDGKESIHLFGREIDLRDRETVVLAAELSGHQMCGHEENWMFDDGTLAATKVLTVIAKARKEGKTFIDLDEEVPRYPTSPEINIRLPTNVLEEKEKVVIKALEIFEKMGLEIDRTDGGLIKWYDETGWIGQALIRKSNTQPMIICRVEGRDEKGKEFVEKEFFDVLRRVSTDVIGKLDLESDDYVRKRLRDLE
ncbi:MAG: type I phosphomannose isomerase catalytic subunit [Candidatus Syntropharchaeia archaeon]